MLICNKCNGPIYDIYPLGQHHECGKKSRNFLPGERPIQCGVCGSTAIDHTEAQCQMNRTFKQLDKGAGK